MSQHFLVSAAARTLSVREVFAMSDAQAFERFRAMRWGQAGEPVCPACGVAEQPWFLASRRQWRCRACGHTFSVCLGDNFCPPQVAVAGRSRRHRDLQQCREGAVGTATEP